MSATIESTGEQGELSSGTEIEGQLRRQIAEAEQRVRELELELIASKKREEQTAEQLRMSAAMFRTMSETSSLGIFVSSPDGHCIHTNAAYNQLTGLSYEQSLGDGWTKSIHPDDYQRVYHEWYAAAHEQQQFADRVRYVRPDNTTFWTNVRADAIIDRGELLGYIGCVEDSTDLVRAREELQRREGLLAATSMIAGVGGWELDIASNELVCTDQVYRIYDLWPSETKTLEETLQFYPPDARAVLVDALKQARTRGESYDLELPVVTARGRSRWVHAIGHAYMRNGKAVRLYGAIQDITERKQAQEKLRKQGQMLDGILGYMPVVTYRVDSAGVFTEFHGTGFDKFGLESQHLVGRFVRDVFPPVAEVAHDVIEGGTTAVVEDRGKWNDDVWCFVHYLFPDTFQAGYLIGFALDITERRLAEETVKENLATLHAIMGSTRSIIFAVDREYRYMAFNSAHQKRMMHLYNAEVSVGMNMLEQVAIAQDREGLRQALNRALNGEEFTTVSDYTSPYGERASFELSFNPIRTESGDVLGVAVYIQDITERLEAQRQLFHSLVLQEAILNSTDFAVITTDSNGVIQSFNRGAERMLQYTAEELIGVYTPALIHDADEVVRRAAELSEEFGVPFAPDFEVFVVHARLGVTDEREWTYVRKDGSRVPVLLSVTALRGAQDEITGFLGMGVDITQRKAAEQMLKKTQEALLEAQRVAKIGSYEINLRTGERQWTQQAAQVIGLDERTPFTSVEIENLIHPEDVVAVQRAWRHAIDTHIEFNMDYRVLRPDGSVAYINGSGKPVFDEQGELVSMIGTLQDISIRKQYERELLSAKETADAANRAKSEFLANMSHEIRTPLNAVLGFAELLRNQMHDEQQKSYVQAVIASGKTLLTLINDILDLSKIEAGMIPIHAEYTEIHHIVEEIRQVFAERVREKHLNFLVDVPARISFVLDPGRLRQILLNLVGNAVKFTEQGYVRVTAVVRRSVQPENESELCLQVEDTGIGIPQSQQSVIFEAFRQQDGQSTRKYGGTGLGLTITKRLVEAMHGTIALRSEVGKGSVFEVVIPETRQVHPQPRIAEISSTTQLDFHNAAVLVADDDSMNRQLLREILTSVNLSMAEAATGAEAIRMAWSAKPQVVLMDLRMPGLNGYEAVERIREIPGLESVPVVIVTASALREEVKSLGKYVYRVLYKPLVRMELLSTLMDILPHTLVSMEDLHVENSPPQEPVEEVYDTLRDAADKLHIVLPVLKNQFLPLLNDLQAVPVLDEVEAFARDLRDTGAKFGVDALASYGETLLRQVRNLDVLAFTATLAEFLPLLQRMEYIVAGSDIPLKDTP